MAGPAPHFRHSTEYGRHVAGDGYAYGDTPMELDPGERIGGPLARSYRKHIAKAGLICAMGLVGWVWINHRAAISEWTDLISATVSPMLERDAHGSVAAVPPLAPLQTMAVSEPRAVADLPEKSLIPTGTPASEATPPGESVVAAPAERLPRPVADPADPYQARALAVGLHPGLSPVLLAKLSPTDFRNAGIAIRTALAETPDSEVFVWPRQQTPKLALFQVKFVPGAAPGCRRYVVMITMDRWVTTALPMENCTDRDAGHVAAIGARRSP
jgi:hypothetical protein